MSATTISSWLLRLLTRYRRSPHASPAGGFDQIRSNAIDRKQKASRSNPSESDSRAELKTRIYRSVSEIPQAEWDTLIKPGDLLKSHAYLRAIEASEIAGVRYYFPVVLDQSGTLVAHACVYVVDTDLSQLLPNQLSPITKFIRKLWGRFLIFKVTDCATPLSTGNSISVDRLFDKASLVSHLAEAVETIAAREGSKLVVIRDFLSTELAEFDVLLRKGYKLVSNMPLARVRVRWASYDEYLSSMRARYRTDVKRRLRRARSTGQRVRKREQFAESAGLWAAQALTVQEKTKGFKRESLTPAYYNSMDTFLGDNSMLVVAERAGNAVAHGMLLQDEATTTATYFGRNPGPAQHEWFHLVNEVIRLGIENRSKYINLGLGSYDAKMNVGADIEPLFVYSKSSIRLLNCLMARAPKTMSRLHPLQKKIFRA